MRRLLLSAIALCGLAGLIAFNWRAFEGEHHYSQVQGWTRTSPLQAFLAVKAAHEAMPFDHRFRMQYVMTLEHLRATGGPKIKLDKEAADRIFEIANSASPNHPAVMIARANYMLNTGRFNEPGMASLIGQMRAKAKLYPETWLTIAVYSARTGDQAQAAASLVKGLTAGGRLNEFQRVARQINLEIEQ